MHIKTFELVNDFEAISIDQLGSGQDTDVITSEDNGESSKVDKNTINSLELEAESNSNLNERKRKTMNTEIYQSFLHPKMFETKVVSIETMAKTTKKPIIHLNFKQ